MARRSGQSPQPVIQRGWWTVRYRIDVPGREQRMHRRERICPIAGPGLLARPEIERRAREIIAASGADTVEHFEKCEALIQGTTFRQQAAWWIKHVQSRKRSPIALATAAGYRSYLKNWLNPLLGDLTLASVDNKVAKDLVIALGEAELAPKTIVEIVGVLKAVLASAINRDGKQIFPREWNHEYIDLPVVDPDKQRRPTVSSKQLSDVIANSKGRYQALYALLGGSGLRIGEALAIKLDAFSEEHTTISSDCKTIHVRKSIWNGREQKPKTGNAIRSVDIPEALAAFLKSFVGDRTSGFLFQTDSGLPLGQGNILRDSLHDFGVEGFHCFRRFRTAHLRKNRVPWDLEKFWIGHANRDVADKYAEQLKEDVEYRREWAEKVGSGFVVPRVPQSTVVSIEQHAA
jgi:integrase